MAFGDDEEGAAEGIVDPGIGGATQAELWAGNVAAGWEK